MSFYDLNYEQNKFIHYAKKNTRSFFEHHDQIPSSPGQVVLAKELVQELKDMGLDAYYNDKTAFAIGKLAKNTIDEVTPIGFFAHVDTADFNAENIKPQVHSDYDGEKVYLDKDEGIVLDPAEFPDLLNLKGQTLITSDGHTLLGVDDKAGIVGALSMLRYLVEHPDVKHGDVYIAFGPDEEIGCGGKYFDPHDFPGVEFAYTLDNGRPGDFSYDTFNASEATIHIKGTVVHPGEAYGLMVNATTLMNEFLSALPQDEVPEKSRNHEGFFLVTDATSTVDHADISMIIRDFEWDKFIAKENLIKEIVQKLNEKYGSDRFTVKIRRQYENIYNGLKDKPYIVNLALDAYRKCGLTPHVQSFRGGTDGNFITPKGIPTPNLFNGGGNYHGRYEYVTVEQIDKLAEVLTMIITEHLRQSREGRDERPLEKYW